MSKNKGGLEITKMADTKFALMCVNDFGGIILNLLLYVGNSLMSNITNPHLSFFFLKQNLIVRKLRGDQLSNVQPGIALK